MSTIPLVNPSDGGTLPTPWANAVLKPAKIRSPASPMLATKELMTMLENNSFFNQLSELVVCDTKLTSDIKTFVGSYSYATTCTYPVIKT